MFEDLVGLALDEYEIYKLICTEAAENLASFREDTVFYFELTPLQNPVSRLDGIKTFTPHAGADYYYSHKYSPVCILLKLDKGIVQIVLHGAYSVARLNMDSSRILSNNFEKVKGEYTPRLTYPRDLLRKGMAEIHGAVTQAKQTKNHSR